MIVDVRKTINFYRATVDREQFTQEQTLDFLRDSWICRCDICHVCGIGKAISLAEGKGQANDGSNIL